MLINARLINDNPDALGPAPEGLHKLNFHSEDIIYKTHSLLGVTASNDPIDGGTTIAATFGPSQITVRCDSLPTLRDLLEKGLAQRIEEGCTDLIIQGYWCEAEYIDTGPIKQIKHPPDKILTSIRYVPL